MYRCTTRENVLELSWQSSEKNILRTPAIYQACTISSGMRATKSRSFVGARCGLPQPALQQQVSYVTPDVV
jgi:hypothetical protein